MATNDFFSAPGSSFFPTSTSTPFDASTKTLPLSSAVETNVANGTIVQSGKDLAFTINAAAPVGPAGAVYASWKLLDPNGNQVDRGPAGYAVGLLAMKLASIVDAGLSSGLDTFIFVSGSPTFSASPNGVGCGIRFAGATRAALAFSVEGGGWLPGPDLSPSGAVRHVLCTMDELFTGAPGRVSVIGTDYAGTTATQDTTAAFYNIGLTGPQYVTIGVLRSAAGAVTDAATFRASILATGAVQPDYTFTP